MKKKRSNYKQPRGERKKGKRKYYTKEDIFISRMASILLKPKSRIKSLFSQKSVTTIRLNPLRENPEKIKKSLIQKGYELEKISWAKNTYLVLNKSKHKVSESYEYEEGKIYIQNLSTILQSILLEPKEGERILDMSAGSGDHTTHLAALTDDKAEIIASESEIPAVSSLNNTLNRLGINNCNVVLNDGVDFGKDYPITFDKVLLNAPSSEEGKIYFKDTQVLRAWNIQKTKKYSYIQKDLIEEAFLTLKHGSFMIYSTFTLEPEENEGAVTHLLEKYPNARLEEMKIDKRIEHSKGITKWSGNTYHQSVKKSIRILPSERMFGCYIAKIFKE